MKFLKIILAVILSLAVFALTNKVMTTIGGLIIDKSQIDVNLEFGANMVATNTLVAFVISVLLAVKVFKIIKGKK